MNWYFTAAHMQEPSVVIFAMGCLVVKSGLEVRVIRYEEEEEREDWVFFL